MMLKGMHPIVDELLLFFDNIKIDNQNCESDTKIRYSLGIINNFFENNYHQYLQLKQLSQEEIVKNFDKFLQEKDPIFSTLYFFYLVSKCPINVKQLRKIINYPYGPELASVVPYILMKRFKFALFFNNRPDVKSMQYLVRLSGASICPIMKIKQIKKVYKLFKPYTVFVS